MRPALPPPCRTARSPASRLTSRRPPACALRALRSGVAEIPVALYRAPNAMMLPEDAPVPDPVCVVAEVRRGQPARARLAGAMREGAAWLSAVLSAAGC